MIDTELPAASPQKRIATLKPHTPTQHTPTPHTPKSHSTEPRNAAPTGRVIAATSAVPVGSAVGFHDNGNTPAWLVHERSGDFRAFSAVCTHAGCTVEYDPSGRFVCPCHGGEYDAATGAVIGGPPPSPLPGIPVTVVGGNVRLT